MLEGDEVGLGDIAAWQWVGAVVSAVLVGLSKAGFGTGAGLLAVPLMTVALGPETALPVMLLVLITGDVFSLLHYREQHDGRALAGLIPGLVVGVGGGWLALDWFLALPGGEVWMMRAIGCLSIAFVGIQCLRGLQERRLGTEAPAYRPRLWHGVAVGAAAGVSSTVAHAGGPLIALFLLPQKLPKKVLVGTMIKYFFLGNLVKLLPYAQSGLMTSRNGVLALILVPAVVVGTVLGVVLHARFSDRAFRAIVYVLALLAGLLLLARSGRPTAPPAPSEAPPGQASAVEVGDPFDRGLDAYRRADWPAAAEAFRQAARAAGARRDPALLNLGLALYRAGRLAAAEDVFGGLGQAPDPLVGAAALLNAGNCAYRTARWDEAMGRYARAVGVCAGVCAPGQQQAGLREVRARAEHNLALARRRVTHPPLPGPAGGTPQAHTGRGEGAALPGAEGGRDVRDVLTGSAAGSEPDGAEGTRDLSAVLAAVARRDTGTVLARSQPPAVGGRRW